MWYLAALGQYVKGNIATLMCATAGLDVWLRVMSRQVYLLKRWHVSTSLCMVGVDVADAIRTLAETKHSLHCALSLRLPFFEPI